MSLGMHGTVLRVKVGQNVFVPKYRIDHVQVKAQDGAVLLKDQGGRPVIYCGTFHISEHDELSPGVQLSVHAVSAGAIEVIWHGPSGAFLSSRTEESENLRKRYLERRSKGTGSRQE